MTRDHTGQPAIDPRILAAAEDGCPESRLFLNRRDVMGLSVGLFTWAAAPRLASAARAPAPRLLIVLLRGGWDGLNVLPNYASSSGYNTKSRGLLHLDADKQLTLSGYTDYRLNAVMTNVRSLFNKGNVKFVLPIAPPLQTRSHFDCSYNLENGYPGGARVDSGWLSRLFSKLSADDKARLNGRPMSIGNIPVLLTGTAPILSWTPGSFSADFFTAGGGQAKLAMQAVYNKLGNLPVMLEAGLVSNNLLYSHEDATLTTDPLQRNFIAAARLFNTETDTSSRVAVLTVDNFDTHIDEAINTQRTLKNFDAAMGQFRAKITDSAWAKTLVVCVSEFGRTVSDNGKGGCDHGIGTVAMLAGGAITKSEIIGGWPALDDRAKLADNNDVPATYDTRDLFRTILDEHLGIADSTGSNLIATSIFPGIANTMKGKIPLKGLLA